MNDTIPTLDGWTIDIPDDNRELAQPDNWRQALIIDWGNRRVYHEERHQSHTGTSEYRWNRHETEIDLPFSIHRDDILDWIRDHAGMIQRIAEGYESRDGKATFGEEIVELEYEACIGIEPHQPRYEWWNAADWLAHCKLEDVLAPGETVEQAAQRIADEAESNCDGDRLGALLDPDDVADWIKARQQEAEEDADDDT